MKRRYIVQRQYPDSPGDWREWLTFTNRDDAIEEYQDVVKTVEQLGVKGFGVRLIERIEDVVEGPMWSSVSGVHPANPDPTLITKNAKRWIGSRGRI